MGLVSMTLALPALIPYTVALEEKTCARESGREGWREREREGKSAREGESEREPAKEKEKE